MGEDSPSPPLGRPKRPTNFAYQPPGNPLATPGDPLQATTKSLVAISSGSDKNYSQKPQKVTIFSVVQNIATTKIFL